MITTDLEYLILAQHEKCSNVEYFEERSRTQGETNRFFYEDLAIDNALHAEALGRIYDICAKL